MLSGNIEQLGGFVGDNKDTLTITDGVFAPNTLSTVENAATFANGNGVCNIENSCYTRALGTIQGDEICLVSNLPEGITTELESGEKIIVGGTTYYKPGTKLKLTIGEGFNYSPETLTISAGGNELVKNDDGTYTLTLTKSANISFDAQFKIGSVINDGTGVKMHYLQYDAAGAYFKIQSAQDLQTLAEYVNSRHNCKGLTFKLMNDIDVSGVTDYWAPIAQKTVKGNVSSQEFAGTFDGQGYTIKNVPLKDGLEVASGNSLSSIANNYRGVLGVGLFGTIGAGKDVFIYKPGEGTDKIMDYAKGDILKILKSNGNAGGSFTKSSFSGGKVVFEGVNSGDSFNINGKNYTLSGKKLK